MYLMEPAAGGDGSEFPWCRSCRKPIGRDEKSVRIDFDTDPDGARNLSGLYHTDCSRPFASLANAINMMSRLGR